MCNANQKEMQDIQQNVQRLGMSLSNSLPSVLSSLNYAPTILDAREALIKNGLTKGNNRHVNAYKKVLPDTLPPEVILLMKLQKC